MLPLQPKYMLYVMQHTSKRCYQLVRSGFPNKPQNHLEMLREICKCGFENLLRWFLGRGKRAKFSDATHACSQAVVLLTVCSACASVTIINNTMQHDKDDYDYENANSGFSRKVQNEANTRTDDKMQSRRQVGDTKKYR